MHLESEMTKSKSTLEDAIALALNYHRGQKSKAGRPYILHSLRVMLTQKNEPAMMVGVLHDVLERTEADEGALEGFPPEVIEAVRFLTRMKGEDYFDYLDRLKGNELANAVKQAEITDNMDIDRIPEPTDKDLKRIEKYRKAHNRLYLNTREAADYFGLKSTSQIRTWILQRRLPARKSGRDWLIKIEDLKHFDRQPVGYPKGRPRDNKEG
jgi:excisionase family DNA binding protein